MVQKSFITGCEGLALSGEEAAFIRMEKPWGFILFARNCEDRNQIQRLCRSLREAADDAAAPIFIDQEGGRVRRLKPPLVPDYPAGAVYGSLHSSNPADGLRAAWISARLIANDLTSLGITGNCVPIVDVRQSYADAIIGNRAYGEDPATVSAIGRAISDGTLAGGVLPVVKHVPGHGRARMDSHKVLPVVDDPLETLRAVDFPPFRALNDLPLAMTAHIVYSCLDKGLPATTSASVISNVIRGEIGFDGALMSDDLSMQALSGSIADRTEAALSAGCDLALHCNGDLAEMRQVAEKSVELSGDALRRCKAARMLLESEQHCDSAALRAELDDLLSQVSMT